ncbi:MAG: M28 family peptidase [Phycisphaerales bacterium]
MINAQKSIFPTVCLLIACGAQTPAWSASAGAAEHGMQALHGGSEESNHHGHTHHGHGVYQPDTARERRKARALRNLEGNRPTLDRRSNNAELPAIESALVDEVDRIVTYLADPAREGRAPGTQGIIDAGNYLENEMVQIGLVPAFDLTETAEDGTEIISERVSFRQPMPMGSSISATTKVMRINGIDIVAGVGFEPLAYSGSESATGPVVFTGYSVVSGPGGYMGFGPSESLKGKIAMTLKYEPMDGMGNSLWDDDGWSHQARLTYKVSALQRRGASAVMIVSPESANDERAGEMDTISSTSPRGAMRPNNEGPKFDIPVVSISPEAAQLILDADGSGRELSELIELANAGGIVEDLPDATVDLEVKIDRVTTYTDNIGGVLRGKGDLAHEYIVLGAHYDHVGYGYFGSRVRSAAGTVHPGADDNASGTSGVLLAAQELSARYAELDDSDDARSVLFLLFTAEESGLNGSKFYVKNPITDLENHQVMLNMDMIGTLESDPLEIGGFESSDELDTLATRHLDASGMVYDRNTSVGEGRSDHASFEARKIPNMFFFTGLHDQYHTPNDVIDIVDMEGAARIAMTVSRIAYDAATMDIEFTHSKNFTQPKSEDRQPRVRIGIVPSDASKGGLMVQRVFEETSASDAGLEQYDRITHWNGQEIESVEAWSPVLLEHAPGEVVKLTVVRGDETIEIEMTLKGIE